MPDDEQQIIADLYELQDDPWDRRSEAQKARDEAKRLLREALAQQPPPTAPIFVDPADDENRRVSDAHGQQYHRLTISNAKLAAVMSSEPALASVALAARNIASGCWFALNSRPVAQRVAASLQDRGFAVVVELVDADGQPATADLSDEQRQEIFRRLSRPDTRFDRTGDSA